MSQAAVAESPAKPRSQQELVAEAVRIARERATPEMSPDQKDELLEETMLELVGKYVGHSWFANIGKFATGESSTLRGNVLMHYEPRLPDMPEKPTLMDFLKKRALINKRGGQHLLQSAALAKKNGLPEKLILACLLHDIAVVCHVRSDHGYYGAQLIEPYVDEETAFAIRYHQCLRFFPDPQNGYEYPDLYVRAFGEDYVPPKYIQEAYDYACKHKWYMSARLVTMNDLYSFDPNTVIDVDDFTDIIGRNFRQPEEGLGFDNSPSAHMWRSMIWPNNFL
jgi:hypothetical protein